jgi:hypothetical protein
MMIGKIPRRIIQTDRSADRPLVAKAITSNLRLLNPDFEYLFFDDSQVERFIAVEYPEYRPAFDSFPVPIQRYDFFRYLAIYHFGGFYFDTDVLLASSLENLLEFSCVFPFEHLSIYKFLRDEYGMDWEVGNYAFGATAGHPFLLKIIKNCLRGQQHPEWLEQMLRSIPRMFRHDYAVLAGTGPGLVSRTLAEHSGDCDEVKVLFPDDVCDPNNWFRFGDYGVHLQAGTWRKPEGLLRRLLHRSWLTRAQKAVLRESRKRGKERSLALQNSKPREALVYHQGQQSLPAASTGRLPP